MSTYISGTNVSITGTNPNVQTTLISTANNVNFCYYKYPLQKSNGFTLTFQLYITATNINSVCASFGITTPSFDGNGGLSGQSGAVELMINPASLSYHGGGVPFSIYTNYGSNTVVASSNTAVGTGTWQTVTITFTPSATATWVVNYNGTNLISYNDSSYANFVNNPNTLWGFYGSTPNASPVYIRQVNMNVNLNSISLNSLKNIIYDYPEECFVNKLSNYSQSNCTAAFSTRLLVANYSGPMVNVRRGSDNATQDFYGDINGTLGTAYGGTGILLQNWLNGSPGYVTVWYDQSGFGRNVIQPTTSQQPTIATPLLDNMSSSAKSSARGIYTLFLANSSYAGAIINIRRSSDNVTQDFYADILGNLGTSSNGTGTSFTSWIGTSTAYVTTWYDQSGNGFHATQTTTAYQPILTWNSTHSAWCVDSQNSSTQFLNLPGTSVIPTSSGSFTIALKHGTVNNTTNGSFIGNSWTGSYTNNILYLGNSTYAQQCASNDYNFNSKYASGNTLVLKWDGTTKSGYINDITNGSNLYGSGAQGTNTSAQYLFNSSAGYLNGQLFYVCVFNTALSDTDRLICTSTKNTLDIYYNGAKRLYNSTNVPITGGNKNYTYVFNTKPNDTQYSCLIEQSANPMSDNVRATVYFSSNYNSYGFVGHFNDNMGIVPCNLITSVSRKSVFMCNHNLTSNNITVNDNGTLYQGTSNGALYAGKSGNIPTSLNVGTTQFAIGSSVVTSEFFIGNINEVIVFNNTLTLHESMLYFTPSLVTRKDYPSRPKFQIKGIPKNTAIIQSGWTTPGPVIALDTQILSSLPSGSTLTSWKNATTYNLPTYNTAPGTSTINITQSPYVTLNSANSQYIDCGSNTFNINTNGGFTVVCYAKFNSLAVSARIFDFGNGSPSDNVLVGTLNTSGGAYFHIYNGTTSISSASSPNGFLTTDWQLYTFRYTVSSNLVEFIKGGVLVSSTTIATAATNRTVTSWIGRSRWGVDPYSNIHVAGLYAYDRALTDTQIAAVSNHLTFSTTSTIPSVIPDYNKVNVVGSVLSNGWRQDQATYFNGNTNSYIDVQDVPAPPMSYCFWFNNVNTNGIGVGNTMVGLCDALRGTNYGIQIDTYSNNTLNFYCALPSTWTSYTGYAISANTWYHVTVCVNTNYSVSIYVNGSFLTTLTGTTIPPARSRFIIGADGTTARGCYGYIYDFRVYDYILRSEEVTAIYDQREKYLLSYNVPSNYLVNVRNWYSVMTQQAVNNWGGGSYTGYTMVQSGSDPNVQLQMATSTTTSANIIYNQTAIQNYSSFSCSFEIYTSGGIGNCIYFFCGGTGFPGRNAALDCYIPPNGFTVQFEAYAGNTPQGINIINSTPSLVVNYPTTMWITDSRWHAVTITYTRGVINTWVINFNGQDVITYSDPNNTSWLTTAGSYWGIGANNQGANMNSVIRRLELNYTPYTTNLGITRNASQVMKYPITALTSDSTTIAGNSRGCGTYIASASSVWNNQYAYYSFQNNIQGSFWHDAGLYNTSTGVYTGGVTTTVSGTSYSGEWIQIQLPNAIQLASFNIYPRQDQTLYATRSPRKFVMAGSNNGTTWFVLHIATGINDWTASEKSFACNQNNYDKFTYFRMIVQEAGNTTNVGGYINFANLSLFATPSLSSSKIDSRGVIDGLTWKMYDGEASGDMINYFTNNTYRNIGRSVNLQNVNYGSNGQYIVNGLDYYSMEWFGYFLPNVSGTWSFYLWTDNNGYLWIGNTALSGYNTSNGLINNTNVSGTTATISLIAGVYYPIRIRFTELFGGDDCQFYFTPPGGSQTSNGQGYYFSSIGTNQAYPAESAKVIKDLTGTNTDGVYYINVNGVSTPIYCLMNDHYDGGGWMMLMKATRGTTFQYSANYWTTQNTLNPGDTTRLDADAKFDTFNYSPIKDILAIWPDIPPNSYTNVYGKNGGSIYAGEGWTWKVDNWNSYSPIVQQLSTTAQNGLRGAYALYKANYNYTGATVKLRRYGDNVEQDFYSSLSGNLGTYYDGSGTSLSSWIGGEPRNIMNSNNWYTVMTVGAVSAALSGTDPYIQSQLVNGILFQGGYWYSSNVTISTYANLTFDTQVYWTAAPGYGAGDLYSVSFGDTSANGGQGIKIMGMFWSGYSNNGFSGAGIYLLKNGVALAKSNTSPTGAGTDVWFPFRVIYTASTTNTWQVFVNGASALTYSDPNALTWAASAGNFFSVAASSGNGLRMSCWIRQVNLSSNFAYVTTWYDQSGNGFHATQTTAANQPILTADSSGKYLIDSQNTSTQFLNMGTASSGPVPTGTSNYTLVTRHGSLSTNVGAFIGAGTSSNNLSNVLRGGSDGSVGYWNYWYNNDLGFGTNARPAGNTVAVTWDGTTHKGYVVTNGGTTMTSVTNSSTHTGINVATAQQYLFNNILGAYLNGQMYHAYVFNVSLGTGDLSVLTNSQNFSTSSSATNSNVQSRMTALTGLQLTRDSHPGNPSLFNGYGGCFSLQSGIKLHGFNIYGTSTGAFQGPYVRWGFLSNNESDYATVDVFSGIGMGNGSYTPNSAGDFNNGGAWAPVGINRSARIEMYGR
jgi:hypothetical protein